MTRKLQGSAILPACIAFQLAVLTSSVSGQASVGIVGGVARDSSSGNPVAEAKIIAHNLDQGADRSTVTDDDGIFAFTNLEPGRYEFAATKTGFQKASAQADVAALRTTRVDLPLQTAAGVRVATEKLDNSSLIEMVKQLLERIDGLEGRLAAMEAEAKEARTTQAAAKTTPATQPLMASLTPVAFGPLASPLPPTPPAPGPVPALPPPQAAAPAPPAPSLPEALQAPDPPPAVDNDAPFAFGDFTWLNGNPRNKDAVLDTKFFTPEVRFDTYFSQSFNQPIDHSMAGSTEEFRSGEFQVEQASVGGDFHWQNVRGRLLTMFGMFASTTPRNDPSTGTGQWDLRSAYKYVSEAWGGYHFDVAHGLNIDAGIFVSYIGLFSYYNYDNWTYQPSYVSSNTPWFFNGLRIQYYPTTKFKIEPWIINGWQSYAKANGHHGFGGQIMWRPQEWFSLVLNNYGNGTDTLGNPGRVRLHTDDSVLVRYYNNPQSTGLSKAAFSFTGDLGCEYGDGVTCHGGKGGPKQSFVGWMAYNRFWFHKDLFAITPGGGMMNNPGRYLTLLPPINGADAISGSPYFTENPGDKAHMWDTTLNVQYMPKQYITWWAEFGYRHSDVPYFSGRHGVTPPGGNNGSPGQYVCSSGAASGTSDLATAYGNCGGPGSVWFPDLRHGQAALSVGVLVKF